MVPVYNGAARLSSNLGALTAFLAAQPYESELVLVDDGSTERAARILREFVAANPGATLLDNGRNRGKGVSVARGILAGRGRFRVFLDSDLAYPPSEVNKILRELEGGADVAIACRVLPDSRYLMSPEFFHYLYTRHIMSRVFNRLVRLVMLRGILDTQAGLKGFTADAAAKIFPRVTIPGFGFDVEALYIAQKHGLAVRQTAVHFRYDDEPSTVRFAEAVFRMAGDLFEVKLNDWRGRYA
ncbi:MAG: glycosyltransferase [Gemmatimonadota bacterium]|nr:glycosyltransferase [Gemmatimonadota bacterium]